MDVKFDLKLFVLVGVLAGFRDVCGTEDVKNKDYDGFIVEGLGDEENDELNTAIEERRVIKAVYKAEVGGMGELINSSFKDKLSYILVWDGNKWETVIDENFIVHYYAIFYNMSKGVEYTVYFIFNSGNVDTTKNMFLLCEFLISVDFRCFNTTNVTDMSCMFCNCASLTKLDLSTFYTTNVTTMVWMFGYCLSLKELNLSSFDTSTVTNMSYMFFYCFELTKLDFSKFDTQNVTTMSDMFYNCSSLTKLDLSKFNTTKVTDMANMFTGCTSLNLVFLPSKNVEIKKRCICCVYGPVLWNNHVVGGLNPKIVQFKDPKEIIGKISMEK